MNTLLIVPDDRSDRQLSDVLARRGHDVRVTARPDASAWAPGPAAPPLVVAVFPRQAAAAFGAALGTARARDRTVLAAVIEPDDAAQLTAALDAQADVLVTCDDAPSLAAQLAQAEALAARRAEVTREAPGPAEDAALDPSLYARAVEASRLSILIADAQAPDLPIIYCNPAFETVTGYAEADVLGTNCRFLQGDDTAPEAVEAIRTALAEARPCHVIIRNYRKDGTPFWNELSISPVRDAAGCVTHFIGVQEDVTAREEARAALEDMNAELERRVHDRTARLRKYARQLERKQEDLRLAQFAGRLGFWTLDVGTDEVVCSGGLCLLLARPMDQRVVPLDALLAAHAAPQAGAAVRAALGELLNSHEPFQRELELRRTDGTTLWVHLAGQAQLSEEGEPERIYGTLQDVSVVKQAEVAVRESEARYRALFQLSAVGQAEVDAVTGRFLSVNDRLCEITGYDRDELLQRTFSDITHADDRAESWNAFTRVLEGTAHEQFSLVRYVRKDGATRWVEVRAVTVPGPNGAPRSLGTVVDVTDRKEAEEALRRNEEFYRTLIENATDIVKIISLDHRVRYHSPSFERVLGYVVDARHGADVFAQVHPDDLPRVETWFAEAVALQGAVTAPVTFRYRHRDGSWRSLEAVGRYLARDGEEPVVVANIRDVTERVAAEAKVREHQRFIQTVMDATPNLIYVYDLVEDRNVYANQSLTAMLGYTPAEVKAAGEGFIPSKIHPDDAAMLSAHVERLRHLDDAGVLELEYRMQAAWGAWRRLYSREKALTRSPDGQVRLVVGAVQDVTERRETEQALEESRARYARATRAGNVGVWEWDLDTDYIYLDSNLKAMLGYAEDEIESHIEAWIQHVHPDDLPVVKAHVEETLRGEVVVYDIEHRMVAKDGGIRWFSGRGTVVRDADGKPRRMVGTDTDITESMLARLALEENNRFVRGLAQASPDVLYVYDLEAQRNVFINESIRTVLSITEEDFLASDRALFEWIEPDEPAGNLARHRATLSALQDGEVVEAEYRWQRRDGEWRWLQTRETVLERDEAGRPRQIIGTAQDVTERKRAEEQIRYQARLLEAVSEGIVSADLDFRIVSWNAAAERLYGWSDEEVRGRTVWDVFPTALVHGEEIEQAVRTMGRWSGEMLRRRRDGTPLMVAISVGPIHDADGSMTGFVAVHRDISERARLEREVLDISGREQQRIGQDLHDGLGAMLTGAALMCRVQARRAQEGKPVSSEKLDEIAQLIVDCNAQSRRLARGLSPVNLETWGLAGALSELIENITQYTGVDCRLETRGDLPCLDQDTALHVYRIAQEAMGNAVKHAQASTVTVRLGRADDALELVVQDDGVGLPATPKAGTGMGMRIMEYRARLVGGSLTAESTPGEGTTITCRVPVRTEHIPAH